VVDTALPRDSRSPLAAHRPSLPDPAEIPHLGIDAVRRGLERVAATQRTLDALRLMLNDRLKQLASASPAIMPEQVIVTATSASRPEARRDMQRVRLLDEFPRMKDAVLSGAVPAQHVDVVARAVKHVAPEVRTLVLADEARLVNVARHSTPENFSRAVHQAVLRAENAAGGDPTQRQRLRTWFRHWVDTDSGMVRVHGEFDPESGLRLVGRLEQAVRRMFNAAESADAGTTAVDKPSHLNALALVALVCTEREGNVVSLGGTHTRSEVSVVIDLETLRRGLHADTRLTTGTGIDLPVETVRRMACEARIIPVVMSSKGVVLDMGRATRLAGPQQRKALEAMHPTCAVPRCNVGVSYCEPHHIDYWTNGGHTDMSNLVPLCAEHHRCVHEGGWRLRLDPATRAVTFTAPGTAPPGRRTA
jgi:Domain of unknown function (DUF222)